MRGDTHRSAVKRRRMKREEKKGGRTKQRKETARARRKQAHMRKKRKQQERNAIRCGGRHDMAVQERRKQGTINRDVRRTPDTKCPVLVSVLRVT